MVLVTLGPGFVKLLVPRGSSAAACWCLVLVGFGPSSREASGAVGVLRCCLLVLGSGDFGPWIREASGAAGVLRCCLLVLGSGGLWAL